MTRMTGRHVAAQNRLRVFVRDLLAANPRRPKAIHSGPASIDLTDLETLMTPRQIVRTLPQLQALEPGTILAVQSGRAAQVEETNWNVDEEGNIIPGKRLIYVGTDFDDELLPDPHDRDTLRRMLPATVLDPLN